MSSGGRFTYEHAQLRDFAAQVAGRRAQARAPLPASATSPKAHGLAVTVRKGAVDTLERNRDKGIGVTVYLGSRPSARSGHASTSDFSPAAIAHAVEAAVAIARCTGGR